MGRSGKVGACMVVGAVAIAAAEAIVGGGIAWLAVADVVALAGAGLMLASRRHVRRSR